MKTQDIIKDAVGNTSRSKVRTGLTVVAIFIGASTLTLTNSIGAGISSYIDNQVGALGNDDIISVNKPFEKAEGDGPMKYEKKDPNGGGADGIQQSAAQSGITLDFLKDADLNTLRGIENVKSVEPTVFATPDYIEGKTGEQYVFSTNPAASIMEPDLKTGTGFSESETAHEIIIPATYVNVLGYDNESDIINQTVTIGISDYMFSEHEVEATVVGVQNKSLFGDSVSLNQTLTEELASLQKAGLPETEKSYISAIVTMNPELDEDEAAAVKTAIIDKGFEAKTIDDQLGSIQAVISGLIGVLNAFAIITLVAASFGIMNTLLMSVKERTREIGLMKAMGMSSKKIFTLFSMEAVFIGFLGSTLGVAVAMVIGNIANRVLSATILSDLEGLTISLFTVPDVVTIILVVMLIAFLSGTMPAARAAKQNPIDALRYE